MEADDLVRILEKLNPQNEPGRITLISRMGAAKVAAKLQDTLQKDCKLDVKLTFREVEREVVVAAGKFKLKPLDAKKNRIEMLEPCSPIVATLLLVD